MVFEVSGKEVPQALPYFWWQHTVKGKVWTSYRNFE